MKIVQVEVWQGKVMRRGKLRYFFFYCPPVTVSFTENLIKYLLPYSSYRRENCSILFIIVVNFSLNDVIVEKNNDTEGRPSFWSHFVTAPEFPCVGWDDAFEESTTFPTPARLTCQQLDDGWVTRRHDDEQVNKL